MEATRGAEGSLDKIRPPRLEDAGLEDCALPPESIKEAFLKAATAVRSHAASIFSASDDKEPDAYEGKCVDDPWPSVGGSSDMLVGITPGAEPPGPCAAEKGGGVPEVLGDKVTGGLTDAEERVDEVVGPEVPERGEACVDGLQGLKIGEKGGNKEGKKLKNDRDDDDDDDDEKEGEGPILVEAYV